ncbi:MAG: hypothetical protein UY14_C0038G0008 [Parcubacteria group bacterium GW2011_GWA1_47_9]|nr:MAG: hypothetical protein UY14_C0038G0008 [Parcubacteria group bacterium GW2011_GWA1_47_9]
MNQRKSLDCRLMPSDKNCDVFMSGTEEHLLEAGVAHAAKSHEHEDSPELRAQLKTMMKDEQ